MSVRWCEWSVDGAITQPQVPRLISRSAFALNVVDRPLGVVVGGIAFDHFWFLAVGADKLVVVVVGRIFWVARAIPNFLKIPIATKSRVDTRMPFSDVSCGVAVGAKYTWPKPTLFRIVLATWIFPFHSHRLDAVLVMPGKQGRSRGHAP